MKVLLVNNIISTYEGSGQYTISIAQGLKKEGIDVELAGAVIDIDAGIYKIPVNKLKSYNIFSLKFYRDKAPLIFRLAFIAFDILNPFSFIAFFLFLKKNKPDVVHLNNLRGLSYMLVLACKAAKVKTVLTLHDISYIYPQGVMIKGEEKKLYHTFFLRKFYSRLCNMLIRPDVVICPSKWICSLYRKEGFFKHSQIYIRENFSELSVSQEPKIDSSTNTLKILYVGKIEHSKGIDVFLNCIEDVKDINIKVKIAGDGKMYADLTDRYRDDERIEFLGKVTRERLQDLYLWTHFTVIPSLTYENMPLVILESYSQLRPVIASRIGGIGDIVKEGYTGFLFESGSCEDIKRAIYKCYRALTKTEIYDNFIENIKLKNIYLSKGSYIKFLIDIYN